MSFKDLPPDFNPPISAAEGGTGQSSYTTGDILYASNATTLSKLAIGSAGQFLKVSGGLPAWGAGGGGGGGDVSGPGSSTDNAVVRWDGTTGDTIQNSLVIIDDTGNVTAVGLNLSGLTASRAVVTDGSKNLASSSVTSTTLAFLDATSSVQTQLNGKQPLDATLTALAAYNTNGLITQTAADTFTGRTITGTANQVIVSNGSGVAGNPTLSTPQDIGTGSSPTFAGVTLSGLTASKAVVTDGSSALASATGTGVAHLTSGALSASAVVLTSEVSGVLPIANGGTSQTTANAAFAALSPMTTAGDIIYENSTPLPARLAIGSAGQILTVVAGLPSWQAAPATGVTSVDVSGGTTGLTSSGGPITSSGTITLAGTVNIGHGGTNSTAALSNNRVMQSSGGAIVEAAAITAARALISDANGIPTQSVTTSAELAFVSGVTSAIQTQINAIKPLTTKGDVYTFTTVPARLPVGSNGQVLSSDSTATTGLKWITGGGTGDVVGPSSAVDNTLPRYDGVTGKLIQGSGVVVSDNNELVLANGQSLQFNGRKNYIDNQSAKYSLVNWSVAGGGTLTRETNATATTDIPEKIIGTAFGLNYPTPGSQAVATATFDLDATDQLLPLKFSCYYNAISGSNTITLTGDTNIVTVINVPAGIGYLEFSMPPTAYTSWVIDVTCPSTTGQALYSGFFFGPSFISIGDKVKGGSTGSIPYIGGFGALSQNNSGLFWDNSNQRLGIGTAIPTQNIELKNVNIEPAITLNNATGANFTCVMQFMTSGTPTWAMLNDYTGSGSQNWVVYDYTDAAVSLLIEAGGNTTIRGTTTVQGATFNMTSTSSVFHLTGADGFQSLISTHASGGANRNFVLPPNNGSAGTFLQTDGSGNTSWVGGSLGDLVGPSSATDSAVALYDGTTGKLVKNSLLTFTDAGGGDTTLAGIRYIVSPAPSINIDVSNGYLGQAVNAGGQTIEWISRYLRDASTTVCLDWGAHQLIYNGASTVDWAGHTLNDQSNVKAADWAGRALYDSGGAQVTLDWNSSILYNGSAQVVNWASKFLNAQSTGVSIAWDARQMYDPTNLVITFDYNAQWSTTGSTAGFTAGVGVPVMNVSTFAGTTGGTAYTIDDLVDALKTYKILAP